MLLLGLVARMLTWHIAPCICGRFRRLSFHGDRFKQGGSSPWKKRFSLQDFTVLWGEVVGCIVLGSFPNCQMTIQLTVFPEETVDSAFQPKRKNYPGSCSHVEDLSSLAQRLSGYCSSHVSLFIALLFWIIS